MRLRARSSVSPGIAGVVAHFVGRGSAGLLLAGLCFVADVAAAEPAPSQATDELDRAQEDPAIEDASLETANEEPAGKREPSSESAETPKLVFEVGDVPELKPPKLEFRRRQRRWFRMSVLPTRWRKMPHGWVVQIGDIGVRWASTTPRRSSLWSRVEQEDAEGTPASQPAGRRSDGTSEFDPMQSSIAPERLRRGRRASSGPSTAVVRDGE